MRFKIRTIKTANSVEYIVSDSLKAREGRMCEKETDPVLNNGVKWVVVGLETIYYNYLWNKTIFKFPAIKSRTQTVQENKLSGIIWQTLILIAFNLSSL